jgi:hypothetical protein
MQIIHQFGPQIRFAIVVITIPLSAAYLCWRLGRKLDALGEGLDALGESLNESLSRLEASISGLESKSRLSD